MSLAKKVGRGMTWNFIGQMSGAMFGLLSLILIARMLGPFRYGLLTALLAVSTISLMSVSFGFESGINKFVPELKARQENEKISALLRRTILIRIASLAFLAIFLYLASPFIASLYLKKPEAQFYVRLLPWLILPGGVSTLFLSYLNATYEQKFINKAHIFLALLNFGCILVLYFKKSGLLAVFAVYIIVAFATAYLYWLRARRGRWLGRFRENISRVMQYCRSMWVVQWGDTLLGKTSDLFLLGIFRTLKEVGGYSIAFTLPNSIFNLLVNTVFSGVALASFSEMIGKEEYASFKKSAELLAKYIYIFTFPLGIGGFVMSEALVKIIYGPQYQYVVLPLKIFFLAIILHKLFGPTTLILASSGKEQYIIRSKLIGLINLALNLILIPRYGILGAIAGTTLSIFAMSAYEYHSVRKILPLKIIFPVKVIGKFLGASLLMGVLIYPWRLQESRMAALAVISLGTFLYIVLIRLLKVFTAEDLAAIRRAEIPFSENILRFF